MFSDPLQSHLGRKFNESAATNKDIIFHNRNE